MTSFGIVDFIANNSLDEVGATPVWEKFRKHFYAVGVGISLFALYFTLGIHVECAPAYSNGTVIKIDLYSRHVNEYCGNNDQLIVFRYSGCMLVGMNAIILLAASYWLYLPNAIKPLRTFSKIRGLVNDIHLPWEELKQLMATPMTAEELSTTPNEPTDKLLKQKKIREIIKLLPSFKEEKDHNHQQTADSSSSCCCRSPKCPCKTLVASYLFRNCVLGVLFILAIAGIVCLTILMLQTGYTFPCTYDLTSDGKNYICAVGGTSVAIVCTIVCVPLLVCQLIAIGYGSAQAIKIILNENRKDEKRKKINYSSVRLIVRFCKSSQSPRSGISSSFIEFFFSKEFEETVNRNVNISEIRSDDELGKLSRALYIDEDPLRDLTSDMREYETTQFRGIVDITKYSLKQYYKLAEMLAKHQLWETFVFLLGNINEDFQKCEEEDINDFSRLIINFDSIATKYHDGKKLSNEFYETGSCSQNFDSNSILYYAIHNGNMDNFDVALFLLSCFKPINPYVHYYVPQKNNQNSVPALAYIKSLPPTYTKCANYPKLETEINKCNTATHPEYECQKALKDTLAVYKEKAQVMQSIIIGILSRRKFRDWDETASEFLKLAVEKGHHEIELALLKAFFTGNPLKYLCKKHRGVKKSIPSDRCIEKIFTDFNYELDDCKYLVAHLAETHSWSLLVGLLNHTNTRCDEMTPEQKEFFRKLKIDLQLPQQNSNSNGCGENIVWAALEQNRRRDGIRFTVTNFLLDVSEPQILYVIKAGSDTKRLSKDPRSNPQNTQEDSKKFKDALAKFELTYLLHRYQNNIEKEDLKKILADVPIREWNDNVRKLAELASSNEDWEFLIAILKTHIAENILKGSHIDINPTNVKVIWGLIKAERDPFLNVCDIILEYFKPPK